MQKAETVLALASDASQSFLGVGTFSGFYLYALPALDHPLRACPVGGVGLLAIRDADPDHVLLVGGGINPFRPPSDVVLYNTASGDVDPDFAFHYNDSIRAVAISAANDIYVVFDSFIDVYQNERTPLTFPTAPNPRGTLAVSRTDRVFAYPSPAGGQIIIHDLRTRTDLAVIPAHNSTVSLLSPSFDSFVASVSENGTVIKFWDKLSGNLIEELQRGTTITQIHSIAISTDSKLVALHSATGTVHIFSACDDIENVTGVIKSGLGYVKSLFGSSEKVNSYAALSLQNTYPNQQSMLVLRRVSDAQPPVYDLSVFTLNNNYTTFQLQVDKKQLVSSHSNACKKFVFN